MLTRLLSFLILLPGAAAACDAGVCLVDPDGLAFSRVIDFAGVPSGPGPGRPVEGVLDRDGAVFAERFAGQSVVAEGAYDTVAGTATAPLVPVAEGTALTVMRLHGVALLNGVGPLGYPHDDAVGEGAIAILFDRDQAAFALTIRGGELGAADLLVLARDGGQIGRIHLPEIAESRAAVLRAGGIADIAGVVLTNTDPAGIALQSVRIDLDDATS